MKSQGHVFADKYPLGRLWSEVEIARRRIGAELANEASINKAAMSAGFHGGKAHGFFKELVEKLLGK